MRCQRQSYCQIQSCSVRDSLQLLEVVLHCERYVQQLALLEIVLNCYRQSCTVRDSCALSEIVLNCQRQPCTVGNSSAQFEIAQYCQSQTSTVRECPPHSHRQSSTVRTFGGNIALFVKGNLGDFCDFTLFSLFYISTVNSVMLKINILFSEI